MGRSRYFSVRTIAMLTIVCVGTLVFLFPDYAVIICLAPFTCLCLSMGKTSLLAGLTLIFLWSIWFAILFSPLYWLMGTRYLVVLYLPMLIPLGAVNYKSPSQFILWLQDMFWDMPLLMWMHTVSMFGGRALVPFYTDIDDHIAVGSLPLNHLDVQSLAAANVGAVINMCREHGGVLDSYKACDIQQLHLPTPDCSEPRIEDVLQAVRFIHDKCNAWTNSVNGAGDSNPPRRVFIHCKGGRGRAVTIALCYLLFRYSRYTIQPLKGDSNDDETINTVGVSPSEAVKWITSKRKCAVEGVAKYAVVKQYYAVLRQLQGEKNTNSTTSYVQPSLIDMASSVLGPLPLADKSHGISQDRSTNNFMPAKR